MAKQFLYQSLIARMEAAFEASMYLEASWYAYAVLEDRLVSLLRQSGGVGEGVSGTGKPIKMMGPKLKELSKRAATDKLLCAYFEHDKLNSWKEARNSLMHAMADATLPLADIDSAARKLAEDGMGLVRDYAAACRRLKKHRDKVPIKQGVL